MAIGSPNVTIASVVFRALRTPGEYIWENSNPLAPVKLLIRSSRNGKNALRISVERQDGLLGSVTEAAAILRTYVVFEVPSHSGATQAMITTQLTSLTTLLSATTVTQLMREEV